MGGFGLKVGGLGLKVGRFGVEGGRFLGGGVEVMGCYLGRRAQSLPWHNVARLCFSLYDYRPLLSY